MSRYLVLLGCLGFIPLLASSEPTPSRPQPSLSPSFSTRFQLEGILQTYLVRVSENWLKLVPDANPAILEMFRDRDRQPLRRLEPWAGEFAGKYLTGAVQVYRLTRDEDLRKVLERFVKELLALQADDGYLGPWSQPHRLTGNAPNVGAKGPGGPTWDAWGHYHAMLGLLLWYEETCDTEALVGAVRIANLLCDRFLGKSPRLVDTGSTEMNLAPIHALGRLYAHTKQAPHLALAKQIADEFAAKDAAGKPLAGDYLHAALAGTEFHASPKPRWESLHPLQGLVQLYYHTGDVKYRQAFEHWWWSIVKLDRHNNGGFSSGEQAQGNPYHRGAIETCCTIAWLAMSVDMLHLTGNSIVADELELSTLNSVIGLHSASGRWCTYDTPMDGIRKASAHDIVFQAREGSPELNCCSVNAARGLGLVSEWALLHHAQGLTLNWYGPGTITAMYQGATVRLTQETNYPVSGKIVLKLQPERPLRFALHLRIPHWSAKTTVKLNGQALSDVKPGTYLKLEREWQATDVIELQLDESLHFWSGERECQGKVSIYRGPLLMTYDRRFNTVDPQQLPTLRASELVGKSVAWAGRQPPLLLFEFPTSNGQTLKLCDFGSAGYGGSPYLSWLRVEQAPVAAFSKEQPLRSGRPLP